MIVRAFDAERDSRSNGGVVSGEGVSSIQLCDSKVSLDQWISFLLYAYAQNFIL